MESNNFLQSGKLGVTFPPELFNKKSLIFNVYNEGLEVYPGNDNPENQLEPPIISDEEKVGDELGAYTWRNSRQTTSRGYKLVKVFNTVSARTLSTEYAVGLYLQKLFSRNGFIVAQITINGTGLSYDRGYIVQCWFYVLRSMSFNQVTSEFNRLLNNGTTNITNSETIPFTQTLRR